MVQLRKRRPDAPKDAALVAAAIDGVLRADLFRALSDATRLKLLACLAKCGRPCSVSEIAACCSVDLSVVSRHLAILADEGVLHAERDGRVVRYAVCSGDLSAFFRSLADAIEECAVGSPACCDTQSCCPPSKLSADLSKANSRRPGRSRPGLPRRITKGNR